MHHWLVPTETEEVSGDHEVEAGSVAPAHRLGQDQDHHSGSALENSDVDSESGVEGLSDGIKEVEEDFGMEMDVVTGRTTTTRKAKNVAAQLQQGVSV